MQLCSGDAKRTLSGLFDQVDSLGNRFNAAYFSELDPNLPEPFTSSEMGLLKGFIPAIDGVCCEMTGFWPDFDAFLEAKELGDAEDKAFLSLFTSIRTTGERQPWITWTWDSGGCLKFGEYPWRSTFSVIENLQSRLRKPRYIEWVSRFEKACWSSSAFATRRS